MNATATKKTQSDTATRLDSLLSEAWVAAGGDETARKQATASTEAAHCRRDIRPGDPIPEVDGAAPAAAVDVICGGGTVAIAYVRLGAQGHALSRGASGFYHPDYGMIPSRRERRLTKRPYRPQARLR